MAKQSIGLGSSANDGTGDDLRTAGGKINGNFDELYAAGADDTESFLHSGRYTWPLSWVGIVGTVVTANRLFFAPVVIPKGFTADQIAIRVNSAVAGEARLGIYKNRAGNLPGELILDSGALSVNVVNSTVFATISQALPPGKHWLAFVSDAAANVFRDSGTHYALGVGSIYSGGASGTSGIHRAYTYGALPADESANVVADYTADAGGIPYVGLRMA